MTDFVRVTCEALKLLDIKSLGLKLEARLNYRIWK